MILKLRKIDRYDRIAAVIIVFSASVRILLDALGWPPTNSDEGVMAIMAMNIAYGGARPLVYYGQDYMGTIEAYLGADFFHLFGGPSLFLLRLGVILLVTLFLICMYSLTCMLFSKPLAIVTLLLFSVGSIPVLTRQMIATGGSSQTLFFGSLAFLLAIWLSSTYRRYPSISMELQRLAAYVVWGLTVGLAIWSDMVVLPFLAMAGLLLLLFCWRELLVWRWIIVLLCIAIGIAPLILYDVSKKISSWEVLTGLIHGRGTVAPQTLPGILHNVIATVQVSIPTATGNPFCPVDEIRILGDNAPHMLPCTLIHAAWGGGYLLLLACALGLTLYTLWHLLGVKEFRTVDQHQVLVRYVARLLLLGAAVLAIYIYTLSSAPVDMPGFHARYLVSLLIATPALIFPLWNASIKLQPVQIFERIKVYACRDILTLVVSLLLVGTIIAFSEVPAARAADQQRQDLIRNLERIGATHFYTDYWSCFNLAFASHGRLICATLESDLQPWDNRVPGYLATVQHDRRAAFVLPLDASMLPLRYHDLPAVEQKVAQAGPGGYRRYEFDGYVVYQPVN